MIRLRMSAKDAHYGGNLVDGAHMVHLFGDVATELLIMHDGDEGLFVAYDNVEFLAPVYAGDYIEAVGEIVKVGNTSRKMVFEARKVVAARPDISASAADVLAEPLRLQFEEAARREGFAIGSAVDREMSELPYGVILHIICPLKKRSVDEVTVLAIRIAEQFGGRLMFWDCPLAPQSLK